VVVSPDVRWHARAAAAVTLGAASAFTSSSGAFTAEVAANVDEWESGSPNAGYACHDVLGSNSWFRRWQPTAFGRASRNFVADSVTGIRAAIAAILVLRASAPFRGGWYVKLPTSPAAAMRLASSAVKASE
jgi:hypothetical protein